MSLEIGVQAATGQTLVATLERVSDGFFWDNNTDQAFEAAPSFADKKITLTEGGSENTGSYTGTNAGNLGDARRTRVRIHDDTDPSDKTIAILEVQIVDGDEVLDLEALDGNKESASDLSLAVRTVVQGTVDDTAFAPTTTQFEADDITEATDNHFNGREIIFKTGGLKDQATSITDYELSGGRGKFTVIALTDPPGNDEEFVIV